MADRPFPFVLPVTADAYAALGTLIVYCGHLEFMLVRRLCKDKPKEDWNGIEKRPLNNKLDDLEKIADDSEKRAGKEYRAAVAAMRELFPWRNDLVHGAWMAEFASHEPVAVNPRKPDDALPVAKLVEATALASNAANHLITGLLIEAGQEDLPLPVPFFFKPEA